MKKILKFAYAALVAIFVFTSCSPQTFDEYELGNIATIKDGDFTFTAKQIDTWTYEFEVTTTLNPTKNPYVFDVRYGVTDVKAVSKELKSQWRYVVLAGTYNATCTFYAADGSAVVKTIPVTFTTDNEEFFQDDKTSVQFALTGGKANLNGKKWLLKEGTVGLGPVGQTWPEWWRPDAASLFNDEFTFKPNSTQPNGAFVYNNNGDTFVNEALAGLFADGDPAGSFATVNYTPAADASWEVIVRGGKNYLILNKAFLGYLIAEGNLTKAEYEITAYSPDEVSFKYYSSDGNAWFFTLIQPDEPNDLAGADAKTWKISKAYMTNPAGTDTWWTMDSPALFDDTFTFTLQGKGFAYNNGGGTFMNETLGGLYTDGDTEGSFVTVEYMPATDAKWSLSDTELTLTKGFLGYAIKAADLASATYTIVELTATKAHFVYVPVADVAWHFELVSVP